MNRCPRANALPWCAGIDSPSPSTYQADVRDRRVVYSTHNHNIKVRADAAAGVRKEAQTCSVKTSTRGAAGSRMDTMRAGVRMNTTPEPEPVEHETPLAYIARNRFPQRRLFY